MLTVKDSTPDVQRAIREIWRELQPFLARNIDLSGRRITNAGDSIGARDYVTRFELDTDLDKVNEQIVRIKEIDLPTLLNVKGPIRVGTYALRGSPIAHGLEMYVATDWDYIAWVSDGTAWKYFAGVYRDTLANRPTPTSDDIGLEFVATDTFEAFYWTGAAWVEVLLPLLTQIGGTTSSFPALKRETTGIVVRLADDSADSFLKVLDEAYDATNWNGSTKVPTQNAVRDKIQTLLGSSAYTPTNVTPDRSYDADATTIDELADVLGTLIADLQTKGILS